MKFCNKEVGLYIRHSGKLTEVFKQAEQVLQESFNFRKLKKALKRWKVKEEAPAVAFYKIWPRLELAMEMKEEVGASRDDFELTETCP